MPVDRAGRETLADAIVAFMKGEIKSFDFHERSLFLKSSDKAVKDIALEVWGTYDDLIDHPISVPEEYWQAMRRWVAFLHSDLELGRCDLPQTTPRDWSRPGLIAGAAGLCTRLAGLSHPDPGYPHVRGGRNCFLTDPEQNGR